MWQSGRARTRRKQDTRRGCMRRSICCTCFFPSFVTQLKVLISAIPSPCNPQEGGVGDALLEGEHPYGVKPQGNLLHNHEDGAPMTNLLDVSLGRLRQLDDAGISARTCMRMNSCTSTTPAYMTSPYDTYTYTRPKNMHMRTT